MIVVPAIDVRGGRCVRLTEGDPARERRYDDDPVRVAARFEAEGAELIHVVDLDAALEEGSNAEAVAAICRAVSVPVQVGGGLRSLDSLDRVLVAGARRAVLGTMAAADPALLRTAVEALGDRIVAALDVRDGRVMVRGWSRPGGPIEEVLAAVVDAGVPRLLVTSIAADGTLGGPDLALYERVVGLTDRPVLASGGVRGVHDVRALAEVGVEGVVVGRALYEGGLSLVEARAAVGP